MLQVAKVLKSNGTDGGVLMSFRDIAPEDLTLTEPVFIRFDGLPVPFFIESLSPKGTGKAIVHLTDVNCLRDAEELVGRDVFSEGFEEEEDKTDLTALVGWTVEGVGVISGFLDIPSNPCLEVRTEKGDVLIPLHQDFIVSMDRRRKNIVMDLPDGLLRTSIQSPAVRQTP